jgi:hypothetical protein
MSEYLTVGPYVRFQPMDISHKGTVSHSYYENLSIFILIFVRIILHIHQHSVNPASVRQPARICKYVRRSQQLFTFNK